MSQANAFVKVGTTLARVKPENVEATCLLLERASKVRSPKQFRANLTRRLEKRKYPKHLDGESTQRYVEEYFARNGAVFGLPMGHVNFVRRHIRETGFLDFFEPLSEQPQFAQDGIHVEETV
jgi:hypothetical protein